MFGLCWVYVVFVMCVAYVCACTCLRLCAYVCMRAHVRVSLLFIMKKTNLCDMETHVSNVKLYMCGEGELYVGPLKTVC